MQSGLWGELGVADERAHRAMVRVQGLLGPDTVVTAVLGGGRGHADQVRLVSWGDERSPAAGKAPVPPWPGRLPAPAPATVLTDPAPAALYADHGGVLDVDARLTLSGAPASLVIGREAPVAVTGWAGPWPVQERWWAPGETASLLRFQVSLADGRAMLLKLDARGWQVEAVYD
jgi:protein ImuB